ncbi:restriction endonuclease [Streptomyces sp. YS-3]|uniref:restriction endonuclease n=1 Tax=Streptomyces sp. YS-3 TaxID=3381352 RepID=UPI00386231D6
MTAPLDRRAATVSRRAFSLRQTVLVFGLLALFLWGVALTAKTLAQAAGGGPPGAGVAMTVCASAALLGLRRSRRRRLTDRLVDAADAISQELAETPQPAAPPTHPADLAPYEREVGPPPTEAVVFTAEEYGAMDADTFEEAIAALCERDGCTDVQVVGGAGDLGADVVATAPDGRSVVIQCKRYGPVNKVGSQELQRFGGTCFAVHEAQVAAVVTTGEFTQPAVEYAEQCGIRCVDHLGLAAWTDGTGPAPWNETTP